MDKAEAAKAAFHRPLRSKDDVVLASLASLARRDQLWTEEQIIVGARRRGTTHAGRLLAIFDCSATGSPGPGTS
jgi:hypothetical protein